jgi:hypothetical protein
MVKSVMTLKEELERNNSNKLGWEFTKTVQE